MTKQSIAATTTVRKNFHTGIDCSKHIKPKSEPGDSPPPSPPSSGQESPKSSGEGVQSDSLTSSSPLERCMTNEEIALLSENCATPLERDLISYLKMQQQQQQQQNQGLHHLHHQSSINRPKQLLTSYPTYTNNRHQNHHNQDVKPINNNNRVQNHNQAKAYQTLTNAPVGPNFSSPTDIANYMSGQNPMDAQNLYYDNVPRQPGLPMPLSQIKKEPDQDHGRNCFVY